MKNLRTSALLLPLVLGLASRPCFGQQADLIDAPQPPVRSSLISSSDASTGSAILTGRSPIAEQKPRFTRTDWTLLSAAATLRFLDYKSTVKMMSAPANFREIQLPQALVHNRPALGAFEAGMVVGDYFAYRLFVDHHHRKLARIGQAIDLTVMGGAVGWNYYQINEFWPKENLFHEDYAVKR